MRLVREIKLKYFELMANERIWGNFKFYARKYSEHLGNYEENNILNPLQRFLAWQKVPSI